MRVLFLTLEFTNAFSGNGTASQSFVRALLRLGHAVFVLCGCPYGCPDRLVDWRTSHPNKFEGTSIPVPVWQRLDRLSSWREFAAGTSETLVGDIRRFSPDVALGVDWSSLPLWQALRDSGLRPDLRLVYYCYRVFHQNTGISEEDTRFYADRERDAAAASHRRLCLCLCRADRDALLRLDPSADPRVLLPALREEFLPSTIGATDGPVPRELFLCCTRLGPEKNTAVFADVVAAIGAPFFAAHGLTPCLVGTASDPVYAAEVRRRLREGCPAAKLRDMVDPGELRRLFQCTALNFHPSLTEAFGMTIVEAAAMGAPTLLDAGGRIGVTDFLIDSPEAPEIVMTDMTDVPATSRRVTELLGTPEGRATLRTVANRAARRATGYTELDNGRMLAAILDTVVSDTSPSNEP